MPPFCKLSDPQQYQSCDWDLLADDTAREAWIRIFEDHTVSMLEHARNSERPPLEEACDAYDLAFRRLMALVRAKPTDYDPLNIYELCDMRAKVMREYHIGDPYDRVKREENEAALVHLPAVFKNIDETADDVVVETLLRGLLAGNKFDLGAKETTEQHAAGKLDFFQTLKELGERPWFVDDGNAIADRLARGRVAYRKAIFFVDNAGGDVVLGALPLTRYLADNGCRVVLAANEEPALNDILVDELKDVLATIGRQDARMADHLKNGTITVVGSGCDCPLIDLSKVSDACNKAAEDADLVILEGMGRAVESNYDTPMTCDCIRVAMIKNRELAKYLGCMIFDLIAKFRPAS